MIGTKLAHYEIISHLGSGGMGDVYQATDTKLGRRVAIKLLPAAFASDAERLARFRREAQVLASLNNPNTAHIYGLEESGETRFIVMELVDGETLHARIKRGPIPLDDCLVIANQIADALEAAHEKGIVHRDLKPGNVMLTRDGRAKVLDFGLASAASRSPQDTGSNLSDPPLSNSPTMASMATNAGMILGTAAYMAPEQARGKVVDKRADIWAFGVLFYEMLTGRRLFEGEDLTETLASVVRDKPDLSVVPRRVKRLLEACLEKNPSRRLQSISDMRLLVLDEEPVPPPSSDPVAQPAKGSRLPWAVAVVGIVLAGIALWAPWRTPPAPPGMVQFEINAPSANLFTNWMAVSPDGRSVAFTARSENQVRLWVRRLDSNEAKAVTNTSSTPVPFWSADSRWIAYQLEGKLRKVEAVGGPSETLCDASGNFGGGSWNAAGTIIFGGPDGIKKVSANGGVPQDITRTDPAKETAHSSPAFLPDGKHFLYYRFSSMPEISGTYIASLDDKPGSTAAPRLLATESSALFAPGLYGSPSYILFRRERALMAQVFDPSKRTLVGDAVVVVNPVGNMASNQFVNAGVSQSTLIVRETGLAALRQLTWFGRDGKPDPVTEPGGWTDISVSQDGSRVAASLVDVQGNLDIYSVDLSRRLPTRLTFDRFLDTGAVWSPDGSRIAFASNREGTMNLFWKSSNGATAEQPLFKSPEAKTATDWSRDGRFLLFTSTSSKTKSDVWVLTMNEAEHKATLFLGSEANESAARFSPDGRFVIYQSDESGASEIYMRTFPDGAGKWQISKGGGGNPRWSRDGKEIVYNASGAAIMGVKVSINTGVQVGEPARILGNWDGGTFDTAPDGRILMAVTGGQNTVNPIKVILNWQALLKK